LVDRDLIITKAGRIRSLLARIEEKRGENLEEFLQDSDRQDIVSFNLQLAIQNCIDIAAHIVSQEGMGVPGSLNETFYLLEQNGYLPYELTEKMVKAIGFRNLLVHEYGKLDLAQVFEISHNDVNDLNRYLITLFSKLGIMT
jgi:uncharacterized protein YutE (UPF0331/DUF86 family)